MYWEEKSEITYTFQKEEHGTEHLPCICICMASDIRAPEPEDMV